MPIREWKETDIDHVIGLLNELNEALKEDQQIVKKNVEDHYFIMQKNKEIYMNFVYEEKGKCIGFISMICYRSIYHKKGTALINELVVSKEHRNQGIGEKLLEHCIKIAKKSQMDDIEVGVMKENIKAINFYKKHGMNEECYLLGMDFE